MKKVRTILLLVLAMLLAGCRSTDSMKSKASAKDSSTASGRSYFWDRFAQTLSRHKPRAQTSRRDAEQHRGADSPAGQACSQDSPGSLPSDGAVPPPSRSLPVRSSRSWPLPLADPVREPARWMRRAHASMIYRRTMASPDRQDMPQRSASTNRSHDKVTNH
jgi:hypothetical protein